MFSKHLGFPVEDREFEGSYNYEQGHLSFPAEALQILLTQAKGEAVAVLKAVRSTFSPR